MGVRTLTSFALQHATTRQLPFSYLKQKTIAVDASVCLYEWLKLAATEKIRAELNDSCDQDLPQFHWEWYCVRSLDCLRKYKMKLIFLFEDSHPDEKQSTVQERKHRKELSSQHLETLKDLTFRCKHLLKEMERTHNQYSMRKARDSVWKSMSNLVVYQTQNSVKADSNTYETLKRIIEAAGLRWMNCESEAEYVAVDMEHSKLVDYVMSNDSDCIACLCDNYISNMDWEKETFSLVNTQALIRSLRITKEQFQIACCCIGNDYVPCLLSKGVYWNTIRRELSTLKLYSKQDMLSRFADSSKSLEFCWKLYTRQHRNTKEKMRKMICGNGRVSPRILHTIRVNGVCV